MEAEEAKVFVENINKSVNIDDDISDSSIDAINSKNIIITDIKMPFNSMVIFMVKWAIASIPAMTVLTILFFIINAILRSIVG